MIDHVVDQYDIEFELLDKTMKIKFKPTSNISIIVEESKSQEEEKSASSESKSSRKSKKRSFRLAEKFTIVSGVHMDDISALVMKLIKQLCERTHIGNSTDPNLLETNFNSVKKMLDHFIKQ